MQTSRDAAEAILANLQRTYTAPHTSAPVQETAFAHLDLDAYRTFRATLERDGYRFLLDYEIVEINSSPTSLIAPTMIRVMISKDGGTIAGYYQIKPRIGRHLRNLLRGILNLRLIDAPSFFFRNLGTRHMNDFESEVGSSYVTTTNAAGAAMITLPPSFDATFLPFGTPLDEVKRTHEAKLKAAITRTGATPTVVSTVDEMLALQSRIKLQKDAHRAASNWVTANELLAMAGGNTLLADEVFEEIGKLIQEQRSA